MRPSIEDGPRVAPMVHPQDASDFARILAHGMAERDRGAGSLPAVLGLPGRQIADINDIYNLGFDVPDCDRSRPPIPADQEAIRLLILMRAGAKHDVAFWLAAILARRAQEPHHLWEDLGLAKRADLTALITRKLPGLAAANKQNMRWKKFFYRQICSDANFSLCLTPSCSECPEREDCFAPE